MNAGRGDSSCEIPPKVRVLGLGPSAPDLLLYLLSITRNYLDNALLVLYLHIDVGMNKL